MMMVRTQITFPPEEHKRAKRRAAELGISLAEYVRRIVARDLERPEPASSVEAIAGLFSSGGSSIAKHKDEYVGEAAEAEWRRDTRRSSG